MLFREVSTKIWSSADHPNIIDLMLIQVLEQFTYEERYIWIDMECSLEFTLSTEKWGPLEHVERSTENTLCGY